MTQPVTLFTGQWADLPLARMCEKAAAWGYDGLELACWGDHFEVQRALADPAYCRAHWELLGHHGLDCFALSNHLVGQAVCDPIDARHQAIVPPHVWGDGDPEGVRMRAAREMADTARAAARFFAARPAPAASPKHTPHPSPVPRRPVVNGFTGSPVWHLLYAFPPLLPGQIEAGYREFGRRWLPILQAFDAAGVDFALEVHPSEIAFDILSTRRALAAVDQHPRFGFNFDPSHFAYQGVDALAFLREFAPRIRHVHVKDVWWSETPTAAGVFGGHADFGTDGRYWDFRSPGRGRLDFEVLLRTLHAIGYAGPLSVEWEDPHMEREHGAAEALHFLRRLQFPRTDRAFDAAFDGTFGE